MRTTCHERNFSQRFENLRRKQCQRKVDQNRCYTAARTTIHHDLPHPKKPFMKWSYLVTTMSWTWQTSRTSRLRAQMTVERIGSASSSTSKSTKLIKAASKGNSRSCQLENQCKMRQQWVKRLQKNPAWGKNPKRTHARKAFRLVLLYIVANYSWKSITVKCNAVYPKFISTSLRNGRNISQNKGAKQCQR